MLLSNPEPDPTTDSMHQINKTKALLRNRHPGMTLLSAATYFDIYQPSNSKVAASLTREIPPEVDAEIL